MKLCQWVRNAVDQQIDTVEMVIALEGKFGLDIPDEAAMQIGTVRQAVEYISRAIESRP